MTTAIQFDRHPDTEVVAQVLRGVNDEISYEQLAAQAGLTLERMRQVKDSARRIVRSENGTLFGAITGYGLKRLTDEDKVRKPETFKKRVFRGAGREIQDLNSISDFGGLTKANQHSVTTNRTVLNVLRQQASVRPEAPVRRTTAQPMADSARLIAAKKT